MIGAAKTCGDEAEPVAGGQTQQWMERYARHIKPSERKWRSKSFRRQPHPEDLPATSKFGDQVVSKVLLLARWRSRAQKHADDRTYSMAARRPWLSAFREVSERSGCVLGAAMEHDGIDPHVEMLLKVANAEQDRRLEQAAEEHAKELTPMDVIHQRVRQAMRGVQLWTNGNRTVVSDDGDASNRGGRRRSSVRGGVVKETGMRGSLAGAARKSGSGAATAAVAPLLMLGPIAPPATASLDVPQPPSLRMQPSLGSVGSDGQWPAEAPWRSSTDAAAAAVVAGAGHSGATGIDDSIGREELAASGLVAVAVGSCGTAALSQTGKMWPDRDEVAEALPGALEPHISDDRPVAGGAGLSHGSAASSGGGVAAAAAAAQGQTVPQQVTAGGPLQIKPQLRMWDTDPSSPPGQRQQLGLGASEAPYGAGRGRAPGAPPGRGGASQPSGPALGPSAATGGSMLLGGGVGLGGGAVSALHDVAPSFGGVDACRVVAEAVSSGTDNIPASQPPMTITRQVRDEPLPHTLTMTKRGRRPLAAAAAVPAATTAQAGKGLLAAVSATATGRLTASSKPGGRVGTAASGVAVAASGGSITRGGGGRNGGVPSVRISPVDSPMGRPPFEVGRSASSLTSLPGEARDASPSRFHPSLAMVDASMFWGVTTGAPHGAAATSGGGGSGSTSPFLARPAGGGGFSRMPLMRAAPLPLHLPHQRHHHPPAALGALAIEVVPTRARTEGGGVSSGGTAAAGGGGDPGGGETPVSPVSPARLVATSQTSTSAGGEVSNGDGGGGSLPARSSSSRSMTSWPGTATGSSTAQQPAVPQRPHLDAPPSPTARIGPAGAVTAAAATVAAAVPGGPSPLTHFPPHRLQPLPNQPQQPANAVATVAAATAAAAATATEMPAAGAAVLGSPTAAGPIAVGGLGGGGRAVGRISPAPGAGAAPVRLSGFSSPARLRVAVPDMPATMTAASSVGPAPSALPHVVSEPSVARLIRKEPEELVPLSYTSSGLLIGRDNLNPNPQFRAAAARRPGPHRMAVSLSSLPVAAAAAAAAAGTAPGSQQTLPLSQPSSNGGAHPSQQQRSQQQQRSAALSELRSGGASAFSLPDRSGGGSAGDAAAILAPAAASPHSLGGTAAGLSRLASDSNAVLSNASSAVRSASFALPDGLSPQRGAVSGPQPRIVFPEIRSAPLSAAAAVANGSASSLTTRREAEPHGNGAAGRRLPEISSPAPPSPGAPSSVGLRGQSHAPHQPRSHLL